jgi:FtsH-binding integral membrane protein
LDAVTSPGTSLRHNRIKIALWVAVAEGLLTLVGVIPHWLVYGLAVVAIAFWAAAGRNYKSNLARQLSWIFATSQAAAVLVPIVWFVAKWAAITAIAVVAVVALVYLFTERDRGDHPVSQ